MRPRTVSFAGTDDSVEWGTSVKSSAKVPLGLSRSQPNLRKGKHKANQELTAIDARLSKLQDRVRQTLSGASRLSTDVYVPTSHHKRASTSTGMTRTLAEGQQQRMSKFGRQHLIQQQQTRVPLIKVERTFAKSFAVTEPIVNMNEIKQMNASKPSFTDQRLQNYADQYDREVDTFASVALHAEIKLQQLDLMGKVPNKLALAVSLDVLRRLGQISGRYENIITRVHDALLPHCYLNFHTTSGTAESNATPTATANHTTVPLDPAVPTSTPPSLTTLHDYLKEKPTFLHVETVDHENRQMLKKMNKLREDRVSSIAMLSDFQKGELVWDALHSKSPFEAVHLQSAVQRNTTSALKAVWDHIRIQKDPNIIAKHLRSIFHHGRFSDQMSVNTWTEESNNKYKEDVVKGMFNARLDGQSFTANPVEPDAGVEEEHDPEHKKDNPFELDPTMYTWLLNPENKQICSDLVLLLKTNVDEDQVVVTKTALKKPEDMDAKRKSLEHFILGATESDISMLRTMVLTWDYENGIEWNLSTQTDKEKEEDAMVKIEEEKVKVDEIRRVAIENERKRQQAEAQAARAHKAIFQFKTNVASKMAGRLKEKARKAKLNKMMSKFRSVALTCVRGPMAGHLKFAGPQDHASQVDGSQIDKEIAKLMEQNAQNNRSLQNARWSQVLEEELLKASKPKANGKFKKTLIRQAALPSCFGEQITSFRMAYKDIKRFKAKSVPVLERLANDVYARHAETHRSNISRNNGSSNSSKRKKNTNGATPHVKKHRNKVDTTFAKTVYNFFLERFGLPEIADANMVGLASALLKHRTESSKLDKFAKFCFGELNKHVATGYALGITLLAEDSMSEQTPTMVRCGQELSGTAQALPRPSFSPKSKKKKTKRSPSKDLRPQHSRRHTSLSKELERDDSVSIPTEHWWCSLSSIKCAMAKAMSSTRKTNWLAFLAEIETLVVVVNMNVEEDLTISTASSSSSSLTASVSSPTSSATKSPRKRSSAAPSSPTSKNKKSLFSKLQTHVNKGRLRKHGNKSHPYSIKKDDYCKIAAADQVLDIFLTYWSEDLHAKEEHLKHVFMAADVDGDGELTTSEFTSLIHSIDHEVVVSDIVKMYKETLQKTDAHCLDPAVFVAMCYENGLVHRAWDNNSKDSMFNIAHTDMELKKTWHNAKPFVLGKQQCVLVWESGQATPCVGVCGNTDQHSLWFFSLLFSSFLFFFQQAHCGHWNVTCPWTILCGI